MFNEPLCQTSFDGIDQPRGWSGLDIAPVTRAAIIHGTCLVQYHDAAAGGAHTLPGQFQNPLQQAPQVELRCQRSADGAKQLEASLGPFCGKE